MRPAAQPGRVEHEVLGVGDDRHVRAEDAAERLVQPRQRSPRGARASSRRGSATWTMRVASASRERARPQRARSPPRAARAPRASSRRRPRERARAPRPGRRHGARRHEVRPEREAREEARAAGACRAAADPSVSVEAPPGARRASGGRAPHSSERRRVEGRRQRGEEQEVRRRAGDEHRGRQRRRGVQLAREGVGERHQQRAPSRKYGQPQRLDARAPGRDEGQSRPTRRAASRTAGPRASCPRPGWRAIRPTIAVSPSTGVRSASIQNGTRTTTASRSASGIAREGLTALPAAPLVARSACARLDSHAREPGRRPRLGRPSRRGSGPTESASTRRGRGGGRARARGATPAAAASPADEAVRRHEEDARASPAAGSAGSRGRRRGAARRRRGTRAGGARARPRGSHARPATKRASTAR